MKIPDNDDHKDHRYRGLFLTWRAGLPPKIFTAKDIHCQRYSLPKIFAPKSLGN
jgi:hypothetical protein